MKFEENTDHEEEQQNQTQIESILLKQASITIMNETECADFLKVRQICAGQTWPTVNDACQVRIDSI